MGRDPSTDLTNGLANARRRRMEKETAKKSEHVQPVIQTTSNPKLKLRHRFMGTVIAGIIRHILTAVGGGLVADGTLSNDDMNLGIGAVVTLVGIGWSIYQKKKEAKK